MNKVYNTDAAIPTQTDDTTTGPNTDAEGSGETQKDPNESKGLMAGGEPPEMSQQDQAYIAGLMKLLHSKKTAPMVEQMLQAGPPEETIPKTALMVNDQMEKVVGKMPSLDTLMYAAMYLVQDLIEIGNVGGFFKVETEEEVQNILKVTMETYIKKGLKDGTIDPVELQQRAEKLLPEAQKASGLEYAKSSGIPTEANHNTAMTSYGSKMERQGMMKGPQAGGAV